MDRQTAKRLHDELDEAVKAVAARYGLELQTLNGTYSSAGFKYKVALNEVALNDAGVNTVSPEASAYEMFAHRYPFNIRPEVGLGHEVKVGTRMGRIIGLNPRAPKYALLVDVGGKVYKMVVPRSIQQQDEMRLSERVMAELKAEGALDTRGER